MYENKKPKATEARSTSKSRTSKDCGSKSCPRKDDSSLLVYIVTWNVGTNYPDNVSLRSLFQLHHQHDEAPAAQELPDIYVLGLQEVNVQPQNQVLGLFKEDPWTNKAKHTLKELDYVVVKTEQMQGLLLSLYIRRKHVLHLRDMEAEFTRTGLCNIWGNKGAVSIRLQLYGCAITFVVSHLAAHDHHLEGRIDDYKQIIENHHYHVDRYREIYDHDYVFWFGDLNFRLMGEDSAEEVRHSVVQEKYDELLQRDQLLHVREQTHDAFAQLHERLPAFPPTFKFKVGTSVYDMKRRPAWTDRILYAVQPLNRQPTLPLHIEQLSYKSHPGYSISDHKPVTSEFRITVFKQYRAPNVEFHNVPIWYIGEENMVEYSKPLDCEEQDRDWIGIYRSNYASLAGYDAYEYVNKAETPPTPEEQERQHTSQRRQRLLRQQQANSELVRIEFSSDIELKDGQDYVLIYFHNTGLRGVSSVAGMSNVFRAERRPASPRFTAVD